ncbi:hypothetical protein K1719_044650 [Acacia pycnantha]|nr:hypothetical protein K1719_044650 [Acacia pycnantha]
MRRPLWWEWVKTDEDADLDDYGADTDFAKVLNPADGIRVDLSNPLCPRFEFEEKERERLMRPFSRTLVVKLLGRQISYGFMLKKLKQLWERKGNIEVFDCENHFYLVNFQSLEDYMEALVGGPWVIADAYLNVARWKPEFNPKNERIDSVVAWVRIPDLPAPFFDKKFLLNLGNSIGKAIRLDILTAQRSRGKFARLCVELDLTKPLVPEFYVEGQVLSVEYESLGSLCSKCGRVGHSHQGCEEFHKKGNESGMDLEEKGVQVPRGEDTGGDGGKWKIVQRGRRQRRATSEFQGAQNGSRFSVLNEETVEVDQAPGSQEPQADMNYKGKPVGQQEVINNQQKKSEKVSSKGGANKGVERAGGSGVMKNSQEGRKERVEKIKKAPVRAQFGLVPSDRKEKQVGEGTSDREIESVFDAKQGRSFNVEDKENIHPGERGSRMENLGDMDIEERPCAGTERVLAENWVIPMAEKVRTPSLAD